MGASNSFLFMDLVNLSNEIKPIIDNKSSSYIEDISHKISQFLMSKENKDSYICNGRFWSGIHLICESFENLLFLKIIIPLTEELKQLKNEKQLTDIDSAIFPLYETEPKKDENNVYESEDDFFLIADKEFLSSTILILLNDKIFEDKEDLEKHYIIIKDILHILNKLIFLNKEKDGKDIKLLLDYLINLGKRYSHNFLLQTLITEFYIDNNYPVPFEQKNIDILFQSENISDILINLESDDNFHWILFDFNSKESVWNSGKEKYYTLENFDKEKPLINAFVISEEIKTPFDFFINGYFYESIFNKEPIIIIEIIEANKEETKILNVAELQKIINEKVKYILGLYNSKKESPSKINSYIKDQYEHKLFAIEESNKLYLSYLENLISGKRRKKSKIFYEKVILKYKIPEKKDKLRLFGQIFVENNYKNCILFINGEKKALTEFYMDKFSEKQTEKGEIEIVLIIKELDDASHMFSGCTNLIYISDISKWNTSNIVDMNSMFLGCVSLEYLPDISNWDISNVKDISCIFETCSSLIKIPDISNWNISKVNNLDRLFYGCRRLKYLPDISKWDTSEVKRFCSIFAWCTSLLSLPDISNWKTGKVKYMRYLFYQCNSLSVLPDISKWDTSRLKDMSSMFDSCYSLIELPDISKWKTSKVIFMFSLFENCYSLSIIPDISKWDTSKVVKLEKLFSGCRSLHIIPDITKWDVSKVNPDNKTKVINNCISLQFMPNTNNPFLGDIFSPFNYNKNNLNLIRNKDY